MATEQPASPASAATSQITVTSLVNYKHNLISLIPVYNGDGSIQDFFSTLKIQLQMLRI